MIKAREDVFSLWLCGSVASCCGSAVQGWDAVERVPTESRLASVLLGEVTRHKVSTFQTQAAKVGRGGGISLYNEASGLVKEELS